MNRYLVSITFTVEAEDENQVYQESEAGLTTFDPGPDTRWICEGTAIRAWIPGRDEPA